MLFFPVTVITKTFTLLVTGSKPKPSVATGIWEGFRMPTSIVFLFESDHETLDQLLLESMVSRDLFL